MGFSRVAKSCMNLRGKLCRLDNEPCRGPCEQLVTFDKGIVEKHKVKAHHPVTAYELGMLSKDVGEVKGATTTQTTVERGFKRRE